MLIYCKPIKGYNAFSDVFKIGTKLKTKYLFSSVVLNKNIKKNELHTIYYGVTISKKIAKKSVIRNRVKRLLRESIRHLLKELDTTKLATINSIILVLKLAPNHPKEISLENVMSAVKNILEQAFNLCKYKI